MFEMSKFKKITKEAKIQKLVETHKHFPTSSQSIGVQYPIIDSIVFLSYNWWNIMSRHFCKKIE
jgi:hypothetical protein